MLPMRSSEHYLIIKEISAEQLSDIELHNTTKVSTPFSK